MNGLQSPGVWVSYHYSDYPSDSVAVHSNELAARRFAMENTDPNTKVAFLPFGIELRDHLSTPSEGI